MRLTACLGVGLDIIGPCAFGLSDRSLKRAALDYGPLGEVAAHDGWSAFLAARPPGARLVAFTTRAAVSYLNHDFSASDILLFGRESAGLPPEVHAAADARLLIPLIPHARSINLSTAAAMALGEALRQTGGFPKPAP